MEYLTFPLGQASLGSREQRLQPSEVDFYSPFIVQAEYKNQSLYYVFVLILNATDLLTLAKAVFDLPY